jgi:hypothetical protein
MPYEITPDTTTMDAILAPYGLNSEQIYKWNRNYNLLVAGSAAVAGRTGLFKPNNVDLWVHADPDSENSANLIASVLKCGFNDHWDLPARVNPLLAKKIHRVYIFTRADNDCLVYLYFTNARLVEVFDRFDITICGEYFDGDELASIGRWETEDHIENKFIKFQHNCLSEDRIAKYTKRGFTVSTKSSTDKKELSLQDLYDSLIDMYNASETALRVRDEIIESQKKQIAEITSEHTTAMNALIEKYKKRLRAKESQIRHLDDRLGRSIDREEAHAWD